MRLCNSFAALGILLALAPNAPAVTISYSAVGNPGNAADSFTGSLYGTVGYFYRVGTYDVTNAQYAEFLNAKDTTGANSLGLWNSNMAGTRFGGINFNAGNALGNKYTLIPGYQNHPVNAVTWYDAIRFANWLNNGQGSGDTETGAYTLGPLGAFGTPINGTSITRNAGATVFLPSESEWYKAAYYDPRNTAQGGPPSNSHYWHFATGTNAAPVPSGPTGLVNHANYNFALGTQLTDVGAYTGTTSPSGAFDMNGNVFQWNETLTGGSFRGLRGGSFSVDSVMLSSSFRDNAVVPTTESGVYGFRVASTIPEPSTGVLAVAACGLVGLLRKWFK